MARVGPLSSLNQLSIDSKLFMKEELKIKNIPVDQAHMTLFYALSKSDRMRFYDLQAYMGIPKSTLSDIVARYEKMGLIAKITSQEDKRGTLYYLTDISKDYHKIFDEIGIKTLNKITEDFTEDERKVFAELVMRAANKY